MLRSSEVMESLDEDIRQGLLEKTEKLKREYEAIQINLIKEALLLNAQRKLEPLKRDVDGVNPCESFVEMTSNLLICPEEKKKSKSCEDSIKQDFEKYRTVDDECCELTASPSAKQSPVQASTAVRRSNRATTSSRQTSSPVLCRKLKRKKRKLFPQLPVTLLQEFTDQTIAKDFALPNELIESYWHGDVNSKHEYAAAILPENNSKQSPLLRNDVTIVPESPQTIENAWKNKASMFGEMALTFHRSLGYVARRTDNRSVTIFIKKDMTWKKLWRFSSENPVEDFQWMAPNNEMSQLFLVNINRKHSLVWLSLYDVKSASGESVICRASVDNLSCVVALPSLRLVAGGNKLTKFCFSTDQSSFLKETIFMTSDEPIVSIRDVNDKRDAVIGCSKSHFYLWNHLSGCLLQRIRAEGFIMKEITSSTSYKGLLMCELLGDGMRGRAAINPLLGLCMLLDLESIKEQHNRLNVYSHQTGSLTICDVTIIRSILEDFPILFQPMQKSSQ